MKQYDFLKVKEFITNNKDVIESATLGMNEDWFWTAETIYSDEEFKMDITENSCIAGISGSSWATPTIEIEFKDGKTEKYDCSVGEFTDDIITRIEQEFTVISGLGCLSKPLQENRTEVIKKL